jgi:hypothetical protein
MCLIYHEQVSILIRGSSEKCVPEPGKNDILWDEIIGLQRFSNSCLNKLEKIV